MQEELEMNKAPKGHNAGLSSLNTVIYSESRQASIPCKLTLTKHSQALIYLYFSRLSLTESTPNPYLSKTPYFANGVAQLQTLKQQYPELSQFFEQQKETYSSLDQDLTQLESIVFRALGLKIVTNDPNDIWSQGAWGRHHYPRIITIIMDELGDLEKRNQTIELKKQSFRNEFLKELERKVFQAIQGHLHPEGIKEVVSEEVYCFIAEYLNFSENQMYDRRMAQNNQLIYPEKEEFAQILKKSKYD